MRAQPRDGAGRMGRRARTALRSAIGLAVTILLLEAVLQVGAWSRWRGRWKPPGSGARGGEKVVLCVGDSFTYGYGASTSAGSYPAQLEEALNESGRGRWKVLNGGWPGQNSWDMLRKLPDLLERYRPQLVYVLVGTNDLWSRPSLHALEEVSPDGAGDAFEWRWRTGRLLSLIVHRLRLAFSTGGGEAVERGPPFLGEWHLGSVTVRFEEEGHIQVGETAARWRLEGERLVVTLPGSSDLPLRWECGAGFLALLPEGATAPIFLQASPAGGPDVSSGPSDAGTSALDRGLAALASGDPIGAVGFLREHVEAHPEDLWVRGQLVQTLVTLGRVPEASEHVGRLRKRHGESPDLRSAEALLGGLVSVGERDESLRLAKSLVDRYPQSVRVWETIASQGFLAGERDLAKAAVERALSALPPSAQLWRAMILRLRAQAYRPEDPVEAMGSAIRAFLLDGDEALLVQQFQMGQGTYTPQHFAACLREILLGPEDRERLERLFRRAGEPERPPDALEGHLRQVVVLCRARGARPALLSYPNPLPPVDAVMENLSKEMGVPRLDLRAEFERALRTRSRQALFVPDGHCNEEGYGIIARVVARDGLGAVR